MFNPHSNSSKDASEESWFKKGFMLPKKTKTVSQSVLSTSSSSEPLGTNSNLAQKIDPRDFIPQIMDRLEASKEASHLLVPGDLMSVFPQLSSQERFPLYLSYTSHPHFEKVDEMKQAYRLAPMVSASAAINELIDHYQISLDCGLALNIAFYLALLESMKAIHGADKGVQRFDAFFGSADQDIPEWRRMIFSPYSPLMGTVEQRYNEINQKILPWQPLSFVFKHIQCANKEQMLTELPIGAELVFMGYSRYGDIHIANHHLGYTCIVSSQQPLRVRSFSLGIEELSEEQLVQMHQVAYLEKPSLDSIALSEGRCDEIQKNYPLAPLSQIRGFGDSYVAWDDIHLQILLHAPLEEVILQLAQFHDRELEKCTQRLSEQLANLFITNFSGKQVYASSKIGLSFREAADKGNIEQMTQFFNDYAIDINGKGAKSEQTALHRAAANGHREAVRWLLGHGASPDITDKNKKTPFQLATKNNKHQIAYLLLTASFDLKAKKIVPQRDEAPVLPNLINSPIAEMQVESIFLLNGKFEETGVFATYRLKAKTSAAKMLDELPRHCSKEKCLAYYAVLLQAMRTMYGEVLGTERFDLIFGSEQTIVSPWYRLIISNEGPLMGTRVNPVNVYFPEFQLPWQPLSFVIAKNDKGSDIREIKYQWRWSNLELLLNAPVTEVVNHLNEAFATENDFVKSMIEERKNVISSPIHMPSFKRDKETKSAVVTAAAPSLNKPETKSASKLKTAGWFAQM